MARTLPGASISYAWRALRHRNFKLFFFGQSISVIGNWMTRLATTWLVYHLTHSALLLGIVSFAGQIVSFALGPFAGVWGRAPRWSQAAGVDTKRRCRSVACAGRSHVGPCHHPWRSDRSHDSTGFY